MLDKFLETSQFKDLLGFNLLLNSFGTNSNGLIQNPLQFMQYRTGSNWDYCICEAFKLNNEIGIPVKCYSIEIGDDFINFVTFKNDLYWYWFESYDKSFLGLHRFKSWIRMINFITHRYGVVKSDFRLGLREINPLDNSVFGMTQEQYKSYIIRNPIIDIKNTAVEDPVNYINENGAMKKFSDTNENGVDYIDDDSVETRTLADEFPPGRTSFNFKKDLSSLKTKGLTFSKKDCWNIFIRRFTDNMADSMLQQIQRLKIKSRVATDPKEKINYMNEANALQREATEKGYLQRPKFYSDSNPDRQASTNPNDPPKPNNMDKQEASSTNNEHQVTNNNSQDKTTQNNPTNNQQNNQLNQHQETEASEAQYANDAVMNQSTQVQTDGSLQGQLGQQGGAIIPDAMQKNQSPTDPNNQQKKGSGFWQTLKTSAPKMLRNMAIMRTAGWIGKSIAGF